ncbi:mitochondrial inner membrane translocase subunit [Ophiocordyceps sinensis CO18]|uniref:Mitochondrial inner membrane translocase subunit n=1 Tax=Ophiocordyceps sinensis (strain Co18 / CGMCC 3.14243) TaxID=911162 RepID=T5APG3_OPHSC|nr:mitochondrial inner membrane translocase subunit [Ophiocordyceps sinensis CO18]
MALDHTRDPCPWVILNDFGGAFAMGAVGGTVWHGIKGFRNSPYGERRIGAITAVKMRAPVLGGNFGRTSPYGERRIGAITAVKMRAPVLGGNFGVWGGLFSTFDCAVRGVRRKEDPFNAIAAGFLTGGSLAIRGGFRAARNGAIGCAVLLAVIEGVGIGFQKMLAGSTKLEVPVPPAESQALA